MEGRKLKFGRWKAEKWNLEEGKAKFGRWKAEKSNLEAGRALMGHRTFVKTNTYFIHLYHTVYLTWTPLLCVHHMFSVSAFNYFSLVFAFLFCFTLFDGVCLVLACVLALSMTSLTKILFKRRPAHPQA